MKWIVQNRKISHFIQLNLWQRVFPVPVPSHWSNMTTERAKWWKAFLPKKKPGTSKDPATTQSFGPDFDPFAQLPQEPATANCKTSSDQSTLPQQESNNSSRKFTEDTWDDPYLESYFTEQTCRRNMKVSRSGRFKEKRRVHLSLPIQEKGTENVAPGKEDIRWCQGGARGDERLQLKYAWKHKGF